MDGFIGILTHDKIFIINFDKSFYKKVKETFSLDLILLDIVLQIYTQTLEDIHSLIKG
jgi:hypothetical protein